MALALTVSAGLMLIFKVPHPPAASNPVAIFLIPVGWDFLWFGTFCGAVLVVTLCYVCNSIRRMLR